MADRMRQLKFRVDLEDPSSQPIAYSAYAFDARGRLVAQSPVNEKGEATLDVPEKAAPKLRIFLAQGPPEHEKPSLEDMVSWAAYEPQWTFDPEKRMYELEPVPAHLVKLWLMCRCRVRGFVYKPVSIHGDTHRMPVCHARVHICEVDPLILLIPRWPDDLILRLRDEILYPRPPLPDPPEFEFDPHVFDPSPINIANMQPLRKALDLSSGPNWLNPQPEPPRPALTALSELGAAEMLKAMPLELRAGLASPSVPVVRKALVDHLAFLKPFWCLFPWIYRFFRLHELAVVETDHYGRFDRSIWYHCFDRPDLYFWVEYFLAGVWTTVYRPWVRCHVYWNYACGSEVSIPILDPRVPWCHDDTVSGKQVSVLSIGNGISVSEIRTVGAGAGEGLTTDGEPMGGVLEPHAFFGYDDLAAAGITHYKWSYRKIGAADWKVMDRKVVRHYAVMAAGHLVFLPYLIGPDPAFPGNNLFQIPPRDPPAGSLGWAPIDAREDTATGFFLSHLEEGGDAEAAQGKYELKLELFKSAAPAIPVNLTAEGVTLSIATDSAPFGPGEVETRTVPVDPRPAHILHPMPDRVIANAAGDIVAFRLVLHVDNNVCEAAIHDVRVGAAVAGPCGFIPYPALAANATISFLARHPHNFGKFRFQVFKGSSGRVEAACAPSPDASYPALPQTGVAASSGFVHDGAGNYTKNVPVGVLLGACPGKAAFSETHWVYAMATDGWQRLYYLDGRPNPESKAFALEPA